MNGEKPVPWPLLVAIGLGAGGRVVVRFLGVEPLSFVPILGTIAFAVVMTLFMPPRSVRGVVASALVATFGYLMTHYLLT